MRTELDTFQEMLARAGVDHEPSEDRDGTSVRVVREGVVVNFWLDGAGQLRDVAADKAD